MDLNSIVRKRPRWIVLRGYDINSCTYQFGLLWGLHPNPQEGEQLYARRWVLHIAFSWWVYRQ